MNCNIPFSTQRKMVPKLFGSIWFLSSLAKALRPEKIPFARCQEAAAGEGGCWSCPGGDARKNCRIQDGISFQQSPQVCSQTPYLSDRGSLISSKMMSSPHNFITVPYHKELLIFLIDCPFLLLKCYVAYCWLLSW